MRSSAVIQGEAIDRFGSQRTLAVVPAFNEAAAITATLHELRSVLPDIDVLVVDDGSKDDTASLARAAGATVIRLPYNLGIGGALRAGFRWASQRGYQRAFQFDADGQHDPREVAALLAPLDGGADMVVGSRFAAGNSTTYEVGRLRQQAMVSLRLTLRILSRQTFTDTSSGFRAFNARMIDFYCQNYPLEYMESVEALSLACSHGFRVVEVPASMRIRQAGQPSNRHLHLAYHFARVNLVLFASARRPNRVLEAA